MTDQEQESTDQKPKPRVLKFTWTIQTKEEVVAEFEKVIKDHGEEIGHILMGIARAHVEDLDKDTGEVAASLNEIGK